MDASEENMTDKEAIVKVLRESIEIVHDGARKRKVYVAESILRESTDATAAERKESEAILARATEGQNKTSESARGKTLSKKHQSQLLHVRIGEMKRTDRVGEESKLALSFLHSHPCNH